MWKLAIYALFGNVIARAKLRGGNRPEREVASSAFLAGNPVQNRLLALTEHKRQVSPACGGEIGHHCFVAVHGHCGRGGAT
jgi:hypothetical protein